MNQNELRIGNYVNSLEYGNTKIESLSIFSDEKWQQVIFYIDGKAKVDRMKNLKPIPLTEKWLIDLGFEPSAFTGLYYDKEGLIDIQISWDNKFTLLYKDFKIREVESVHDLQNLHFALAKEELKINEP